MIGAAAPLVKPRSTIKDKALNPDHYRRLEALYDAAPINRLFPSRIQISQGAARIDLDIAPGLFHGAGAAHGAVYFKLLDDACFFAVNSRVEEVFVLTTAFNMHLTRPLPAGPVTAEGHWLSGARRVFLAEAVLKDAHGREAARGTGTFMKSRIPLGSLDGYGKARP